MPKTYVVPPPPHHNEGKTVASWTMNLGIVLGSVVLAAGMILPDLSVLIWVGAAIVALAIIAGIVLSAAGLGQPKHYGHPVTGPAARTHEAPAAQVAEADAR